ncbi:MAG: protein-export chaperone SecB [Pseudomonadota bacterium]
MAEENAAATEQPRREVGLRKLYIKDLSFESPGAPGIFTKTEFRPQTNLNLRTTHQQIDDTVFEMTLTLTIDAKIGEETAFLVELQQAGLFHIAGYDEAQRNVILGTFCPNALFPYARETISGAVQRGGFPEFLLQPIDFDALFARSQQEMQKQQQAEASEPH